MNRRRGPGIAVLLALLGLLGLVWYGARPPGAAPAVALPLELVDESTVSPLAGAVLVRSAGAGAWAPAIAGQPLSVGDAVRTAAGAHALITFFEGSMAALEPEAELVVGRLDRDAGDLRTGVRARLLVGGAWFRVPPALDPGSRFDVETPAAVAVAVAVAVARAVEHGVGQGHQQQTVPGARHQAARPQQGEVPAAQDGEHGASASPSGLPGRPDPAPRGEHRRAS